MKIKLLVFGMAVLLSGLSASLAMACNCGKKAEGNQASSCQCAGSCGGQAVSTESSFQLAQANTMQPKEEVVEAKATEVGNKICPVSGEKVGEMGDIVKVEYNGKVYNLCCAMCKKDFLKNPEKYSKIAEEEVKQYEEEGVDHEETSEGDHDHEAGEHHHIHNP